MEGLGLRTLAGSWSKLFREYWRRLQPPAAWATGDGSWQNSIAQNTASGVSDDVFVLEQNVFLAIQGCKEASAYSHPPCTAMRFIRRPDTYGNGDQPMFASARDIAALRTYVTWVMPEDKHLLIMRRSGRIAASSSMPRRVGFLLRGVASSCALQCPSNNPSGAGMHAATSCSCTGAMQPLPGGAAVMHVGRVPSGLAPTSPNHFVRPPTSPTWKWQRTAAVASCCEQRAPLQGGTRFLA